MRQQAAQTEQAVSLFDYVKVLECRTRCAGKRALIGNALGGAYAGGRIESTRTPAAQARRPCSIFRSATISAPSSASPSANPGPHRLSRRSLATSATAGGRALVDRVLAEQVRCRGDHRTGAQASVGSARVQICQPDPRAQGLEVGQRAQVNIGRVYHCAGAPESGGMCPADQREAYPPVAEVAGK